MDHHGYHVLQVGNVIVIQDILAKDAQIAHMDTTKMEIFADMVINKSCRTGQDA